MTQKIKTPFSRHFENFQRRWLPILVWSGAVLLTSRLFDMRQSSFEYVGMATVNDYVISAPQDAIIDTLVVASFQEVTKGQVVATLDSRLLQAQLQTAQLEAQRLTADRQAVLNAWATLAANTARDFAKDARRFKMDLTSLRLDALSVNTKLALAQIAAQRAQLAYERSHTLSQSQVSPLAKTEDLELAWRELQAQISRYQAHLMQLSLSSEEATQRLDQFLASTPGVVHYDSKQLALDLSIAVQASRVKEWLVRSETLVLRAPAGGVVRAVLASPGRSVVLGEPLLSITPHAPYALIFYQPQHDPKPIALGAIVEVRRLGGMIIAMSQVTALGTQIERLPESLWRDPTIPEYGQAVRLAPCLELELIPGDPISTRLVEQV